MAGVTSCEIAVKYTEKLGKDSTKQNRTCKHNFLEKVQAYKDGSGLKYIKFNFITGCQKRDCLNK